MGIGGFAFEVGIFFSWSLPLSFSSLLSFSFAIRVRQHTTQPEKPPTFLWSPASGFLPGVRGSAPPTRLLRHRGLDTPCTAGLYALDLRLTMPQGHHTHTVLLALIALRFRLGLGLSVFVLFPSPPPLP